MPKMPIPMQTTPTPQPNGSGSEERPSEDDRARNDLGGTRGSPNLPDAPMTKGVAEQTFPNDEPGHVA
ncbi:MAG: hypothetical protein Q7T81_02790 [Pseudolabrys sp.]|nr:hypothetical protein [Pseudolabrys sp.]